MKTFRDFRVGSRIAASKYGGHYLSALLGIAVIAASLAGCGEVVSSRRSAPLTATDRPVKVGDVIYYNLPIGVIRIDGVFDKDKGWMITVAPDIRADIDERYELEVGQRYPFFDDNAILTTDDKGLLKSVSASSQDHSVDAAGALITAGGQVLEFGASGGLPLARARATSETPTPPPFHVVLDPFKLPKKNGPAEERAGFKFYVNRPSGQLPACPKDIARDNCEGRYAGIMTRLTLPFIVTIEPTNSSDAVTQTTVLLPDKRQRYLLSVPRRPFVTSDTKIEFKEGSMITRDIKRPSLGYAILGIPKTILGALVPIPGAVQKAEITRIQNQSSLIKETATLHDLQNPSPTPTATATSAAPVTATPTPTAPPVDSP